ncbi:hypothetical protein [Mycobacterium sp. CnD-18-1]|uniref:hypothetical protein n=1 Tax=Mycobacterium sp. CnD-18-1 TaxID=2917744 RepID=UPI001EF16DE5|nr:hypothetical protein [Mycobacterium sp. CnD-18-1]MCG7607134.1 hypothetical protein [Mycobacterium sp. CnD-18-1]
MIDIFTRHGVCAHCEQPIHSVGRSAIHTDTDMFTCEGGHAEFLSTENTEGYREVIFQEGYDQGVDDTQEEVNQAFRDGRREYARALYKWLEPRLAEPGVLDELLDKLADD